MYVIVVYVVLWSLVIFIFRCFEQISFIVYIVYIYHRSTILIIAVYEVFSTLNLLQ